MSKLIGRLRKAAEDKSARFNLLAERQGSDVRLKPADYDDWKAADALEQAKQLLAQYESPIDENQQLRQRVKQLQAALFGENGALLRMDRARTILSKADDNWQVLNTADIRGSLSAGDTLPATEWTKDAPTEPGWYWWRQGERVEVARIGHDGIGPIIAWIGEREICPQSAWQPHWEWWPVPLTVEDTRTE